MTHNKFSNWHVLLIIAVVLPVYPLLLQQGMLLQHDIFASDLLHNQFPYRAFLGKYIAQGIFPLWMPDIFSGVPFLAQIEAGPLFVPNWILFGLFGPHVALNLSIVFTFLFGALGTFLLARCYGADNISASLAGVVFALAGFNVSHVKHMNMHEAAAILPWMMVCLERGLRSRSHFWLIALSLVLALQITAGHPQITYYSLLFLFARFLVYAVQQLRDARKGKGKSATRALAGKTLGLAASVAIGTGICGLQLITTYKFNQASIRGTGLDWQMAAAFPYHLPDLQTFVYPSASGMFERMDYRGALAWENYGYFGVIPLILAVACGFLVGTRAVWFYVGSVIVSMLIVVGPATPLYRLLWEYLPGMNLFRFPTRFLLIVNLSGAVLSGLALAYIGRRLARRRGMGLARVVLWAVFVLVAADLFYWQRSRMPIDDLKEWRRANPSIAAVHADGNAGRIYSLMGTEVWRETYRRSRGFAEGFATYRLAGQVPLGNLSVIDGLMNVEGYTNMINARTASFWLWYNLPLLKENLQPPKFDPETRRITDEFNSLLNIANVVYLLSPVPLTNPNYRLLTDGEFKLYKNATALPRAYIAYAWQAVGSVREAARWIFVDGQNHVPTIEGTGASRADSVRAITAVAMKMVTPHRYECDIQPETSGYLVFNESFDPGWTAEVDGEPTEIHIANGYQKAVKVGADSRRVTFVYRPEGFRSGGVISVVSLVVLLAWAVFYAGVARHRSRPRPSQRAAR